MTISRVISLCLFLVLATAVDWGQVNVAADWDQVNVAADWGQFDVAADWGQVNVAADWDQLDALLNQYINTGAFPGASLRIANKTHTVYSNNYGHLSSNPPPFGSPMVSSDTVYDIASLSKVTGTLGCIMQLVDVGLLHIGDLVIKHIPEYNNHGK